jgi:hypothetical protein
LGGWGQPGSTGRRDGGQGDPDIDPEARGLEAIARYGVGDPDPETGLFESYDLPEALTAGQGEGGIPVLTLLEQWDLIELDFSTVWGIRLSVDPITWREFKLRLSGLLSCDSRLSRHFAPNPELDPGETP